MGGQKRWPQVWLTGLSWENKYESAGISKKDLPQLQDCSAQARAFRHLYRQKAQTKARLNNGKQWGNRLLPTVWFRYNTPFAL